MQVHIVFDYFNSRLSHIPPHSTRSTRRSRGEHLTQAAETSSSSECSNKHNFMQWLLGGYLHCCVKQRWL